MVFIVLTLMLGDLFLLLVSRLRFFQERRVERARCRKSAKARSYQTLMCDLPDVIWPEDVYRVAFNF